MDPNGRLGLAKDQGDKKHKDIVDYQAVVGSLMYAALATRPDISYAVATLSRYNSRPFTIHMTPAKRVLRYLKYTADFPIHFNHNGDGIGIGISNGIGIGIRNGIGISLRNDNTIGISNDISIGIGKCIGIGIGNGIGIGIGYGIGIGIGNGIGIDIGNCLVGYLHSDWANDSADRKSQGGHMSLASNGGAVSWKSQKQGIIARSTLEAKFISCSEASIAVEWLFQLQKDIHDKDLPLLAINCDNQAALALITQAIIKAHTKHIDVCYHHSQDLQKQQILNYFYVHTEDNVAYIFTKSLTEDKETKFTKAMGLR